MKKTIRIIKILLLAVNALNTFAQSSDSKTVNTVQPTIMVIPFAKENEDMRTILEADFNKKIAISKVKEGFDNRDFTTVDFVAKLKQAMDDKIFTSDKQSDLKSTMIQFSGADIYVEVDLEDYKSSSGNSAKVVLTAYDASTALALANKTCISPRFNTSDYGALVTRALGSNSTFTDGDTKKNTGEVVPCLEDFLNTINKRFSDVVANGRPIKVNFSLSPNSKLTFSSDIKPDGLPLSDVLDNWMGDNSVKNNYHNAGGSDLKLFFDLVRIPLKDENNRNYNPTKFALKIYQFLKSKGLNSSKEIKNGTIFITIN